MIAGLMKYKLLVLRPAMVENSYGERTSGFKECGTIRAERVKFSGSLAREAGELFSDYRVEFNIRYPHQVEEHWHVRQIGGHEYVVTNVIPNIDRGMKTLVCERFNK